MEIELPIAVQIVGMAWYKREEYDACRRIMKDGAKLPASFHVWLMKAETGEKQLRRQGKTVVRAFIDPKTFPDWCRERDLNVDAGGRIQFANAVAMQIATGGKIDGGATH